MAPSFRPVPPTSSLLPVSRLQSHSTDQVEQALLNLHAIYRPHTFLSLSSKSKILPKHLIHDLSVPDSGYASAEEEDGSEEEMEDEDEENVCDLDVLRSDAFEREFTVRWLTAFTARSDTWVYDPSLPEEQEERARLVDNAASLLASFAGEDEEEGALTRTFVFPRESEGGGCVEVELNDAPPLSEDHTSVGLQSWGSSIILAEQMCACPGSFGLSPSHAQDNLRVLEMGAGTGLLSITAGKLLQSFSNVEIVATDYHPSVLDNLEANVVTNFTSLSSSPIAVVPLDWQTPILSAPLNAPFDVILAADVIYHPDHAKWIKSCVEALLVRPDGNNSRKSRNSVFWLIIPVRSIGRHEGMGGTVEAVFPRCCATSSETLVDRSASLELAILSARRVDKHDGVGRADESGYTLFEIGWVSSSLL